MINESSPDPHPHMNPALITNEVFSFIVGLFSVLLQVIRKKEKKIIKSR
jgi:hypothetical protein